MAAAKIPFVLAVDVGSPKTRRLRWADGSAHGCAKEFPDAVDRLSSRLETDGRAAIGFGAPIWTPRRTRLTAVTDSRQGMERKLGRPWTASAGASALTTALGLMTWTFARIARAVPELAATIDPAGWQERGGLLVWEAFVTGATRRSDADNAATALEAFAARWPDLRSDIPVEAALNLAVAAALSAGLCVDLDEIGAPSIVIAAFREEVTAMQSADRGRDASLQNRPVATAVVQRFRGV
jgi:hypothetical protein